MPVPTPDNRAAVDAHVEAIKDSYRAGTRDSLKNTLDTAKLIAAVHDSHLAAVKKALRETMSKSKVSKFRGIGQCERFYRDEVKERLPSSFVALYNLSLLDEAAWDSRWEENKIHPKLSPQAADALRPDKPPVVTADKPRGMLVARIRALPNSPRSPNFEAELLTLCEKFERELELVSPAADRAKPKRSALGSSKVEHWMALTPSTSQAPRRARASFLVDFANFLRGTGEHADVALIVS